MTDILIVEDHAGLAELMETFLKKDGYAVKTVHSGEEALVLLKSKEVKLVLLDIMLPGMDGFAVCCKIRMEHNTPVIMMSAKSDKEDKMNGFLQGADDYIEKPVDIDLLRAKIGAMMRRSYELREKHVLLYSGNLTINQDARKVYLKEKELSLTGKEYELLLLFVENPGRTLSKEYLFQQIWGADSFSENQTLTVHVKMLRDKIEKDPKKPECVQTVWGVGYRYEEI